MKGLNSTEDTDKEGKAIQGAVLRTQERKMDEWDALLERSTYLRTLRVTAWVLRFINNFKARRNKFKKTLGPLVTEEITTARNYWVKRVQKADKACLQSPGWNLMKGEHRGVLKCEGRNKGYRSTYLSGGPLAEKLMVHTRMQSNHASWCRKHGGECQRELVDKSRAKVKKRCNVCKVFSPKLLAAPCQNTEWKGAGHLK